MPVSLWLWLKDRLSLRTAFISFRHFYSVVFPVEWGLSQRSVLSAPIYIIYTSDMDEQVFYDVDDDHFYADDGSLVFSVPFGLRPPSDSQETPFIYSCHYLQIRAQRVPDRLEIYCAYWMIELSTKKTVAMMKLVGAASRPDSEYTALLKRTAELTSQSFFRKQNYQCEAKFDHEKELYN
ncbi:unnamed protein product [Didymodactylos carnosus]|uniref:Uncharacterized protein n=1 Tax=Didymodactylos carnosus TaxID=1234261 RepID=A0A814WKN9_9BILA|nr:unnamed protein product [Didymodactylos carnosus]CAF3967295.1 unnamed protein product [Didymodactylos carnosus]